MNIMNYQMLAAHAPGLDKSQLCQVLTEMDQKETTKLNSETGNERTKTYRVVEAIKGSVYGASVAAVCDSVFSYVVLPLLGAYTGGSFVLGGAGIFGGGLFGFAVNVMSKEGLMPDWPYRYCPGSNIRYARLRSKVTLIDIHLETSSSMNHTAVKQLKLAKTFFQSTADSFNRTVKVINR